MHYCLNKEELRQLIELKANNVNIEDRNLQIRVENAENWQDELGALSYFFSHILERKHKCGENCQNLIKTFYHLEEMMFFRLQEFDWKFIEYMLKNLRGNSTSLEEKLIELQNNMSEYRYEHTLRY